MNIFDKYKNYRLAFKNPISVMWAVYMKKNLIPVKFKHHRKIIWAPEWVWNYMQTIKCFPENAEKLKQLYITSHSNKDKIGEFIEFEYKNYLCKFYGVMEGERTINGAIEEIFFREEYEFLNPEKSIILDIGANIGDSAIYFCLNNAERVIALEPFPFSYKYANINVTANKMNNKIEILNAGYGKDSEVKVKDKKSTGGDILEISNDGKKLNIFSLRTLINMYSLNNKDNLLLKMDCEGCEYNLLNEPVDVLRKFKRIEMEFHYGYKNLKSKLEKAGFYVDHSKPSDSSDYAFLNEPSLRKMALINKDFTIGMIYAERHSE